MPEAMWVLSFRGRCVYNDFVNLKRAQGQDPFVYLKDGYQLATTLLRTRCLGSAS